jgi:MFS family permease
VYLSLAPRTGYTNPLLLLAFAGGAVSAVGFVIRQRRAEAPLIDLSILRPPAISIGLSSGLVSYLVLFGTLFVVPYYLVAEHTGAALIGLQLAALPVAIGIAAPIAGRLVTRIGERPLTAGGLVLTAAGLLEIALRHGTTGLVAGLALAGLGLGAFTPANNATIMSASPPGHAGVLSGVLNMTRGAGTAIGVALAGAIFTAAAGTTAASLARTGNVEAAHGMTVTFAVLGLVALATGLALVVARRGDQRRDQQPERSDRHTPRSHVGRLRTTPRRGHADRRLPERAPHDGSRQLAGGQ